MRDLPIKFIPRKSMHGGVEVASSSQEAITYNPIHGYGDPVELALRMANIIPKLPPHIAGIGTATVYVLPLKNPLRARRRAIRAGRLARHHLGRNRRRAAKWANAFRRHGGIILHEKDFGGGAGLRSHMASMGDLYPSIRGSDTKTKAN